MLKWKRWSGVGMGGGTWEFEGRKVDGRFIFTEYLLISCETRS